MQEQEQTSGSDEAFRRYSPGPIALLVPALALILGVLWAWRAHRAPAGDRAAPPALPSASDIPGWVGIWAPGGEGGARARLVVRLVPLHTSSERQRFEAQALGGRFDKGEGEPWRLLLDYQPTGEPGSFGTGFAVENVRVVDEHGLAVTGLVSLPESPGPGEVADPLRVLLAPPRAELGVGQELSLVLWGRAPVGAAHLEGLGERIPLHPQGVPRSDLQRALARLDPRPADDAHGERSR